MTGPQNSTCSPTAGQVNQMSQESLHQQSQQNTNQNQSNNSQSIFNHFHLPVPFLNQ